VVHAREPVKSITSSLAIAKPFSQGVHE